MSKIPCSPTETEAVEQELRSKIPFTIVHEPDRPDSDVEIRCLSRGHGSLTFDKKLVPVLIGALRNLRRTS